MALNHTYNLSIEAGSNQSYPSALPVKRIPIND